MRGSMVETNRFLALRPEAGVPCSFGSAADVPRDEGVASRRRLLAVPLPLRLLRMGDSSSMYTSRFCGVWGVLPGASRWSCE